MNRHELIEKLDKFHETRRSMSHASIYHGTYEDKAITLNRKLVELTGFNYIEHKAKMYADRIKFVLQGVTK